MQEFSIGSIAVKGSGGRQPDDHNLGSLIMLAVTTGVFLLVAWVATKGLFFFLQESPIR
jgi:hypothetical protein